MNKEKNLIDQRASLRVDTRETQHGVADIGISRTGISLRHIDGVTRSEVFFASRSIVSTMAETTELIKLLADQIQVQRQQMEQQAKQMEQHSLQHRAEMEQRAQQMEQQAQHHREEMHNLLKILDV